VILWICYNLWFQVFEPFQNPKSKNPWFWVVNQIQNFSIPNCQWTLKWFWVFIKSSEFYYNSQFWVSIFFQNILRFLQRAGQELVFWPVLGTFMKNLWFQFFKKTFELFWFHTKMEPWIQFWSGSWKNNNSGSSLGNLT
jgi:hypothetical protein